MKIVICHLTRMQKGYICAAGIDIETGNNVRPVLPSSGLPTDYLVRNGGHFDMANLVLIDNPRHLPVKPHTEDYVISGINNVKAHKTADPNKFWNLLTRLAQQTLSGIFGNDLILRGQSSCATDKGKGKVSLGYFLPNCKPMLYLSPQCGKPDKIRIEISDGVFNLDLSVTDIRLYQDDHITPNNGLVNHIAGKLHESNVILSVGLTRVLLSPGFNPVHWLQVNNIHLQDNPVWQLG